MATERYPVDLIVTNQDFAECGWKAVLESTSREGYPSMRQAFSSAARQAMQEGHQSFSKVFWLLADACSMMLSPKSPNEPFKPFKVLNNGQRSTIPDDLSEADITFFSQIVELIDDPWLKARLSDLVWLKQRPRDVQYALAAIDAYRAIPLDTSTWVHGGGECWERAFSLARMLNAGAGARLQEMEAEVIRTFDASTVKDGFLCLRLAALLEQNNLGRNQPLAFANKLESLAREFDGEADYYQARDYFDASANWFKIAGDKAKKTEMIVYVAESWAKEAVARISCDQPSHLVAADFYEKAIQCYRSIPRSERAIHRVDERIAELRAHLNDSSAKLLDEMKTISSEGVDISRIVEDARNSVRNKTPLEAMKAFANLHPGANVNKLRESAIELLRQHALSPEKLIGRDGRVIAKRPGISLNVELSDDDEISIRAEMVNEYQLWIGRVVYGMISPALEVLLLEHRLQEADFIGLARQSPIVPMGREHLFGKALFSGYDRDFVSALHLLIPQIEHMVRFHLKAASVNTTHLDKEGNETENGLSTLMDIPEVTKIFGEDLAFEIRALFCDAFGPNLRNEIAHGLLDDEACRSIYAIYAWWLGLKVVFNNLWNAAQQDSQ